MSTEEASTSLSYLVLQQTLWERIGARPVIPEEEELICMPRYFFDIRDGETFAPDEDGTDLPDEEAATQEATLLLGELAKCGRGIRIPRRISLQVRSGSTAILRGAVSMEMERRT